METLNYFNDMGSKGKLLLGDEEIIFRDMGRSKRYFQGSRENRTPFGAHKLSFKFIVQI